MNATFCYLFQEGVCPALIHIKTYHNVWLTASAIQSRVIAQRVVYGLLCLKQTADMALQYKSKNKLTYRGITGP
jgi:hypothetical protein